MTGGNPGAGGRRGTARLWALVLAASFLAGLAAVGIALLVPEDEKRDEGAPSAFSPPPPAPAQPAPVPPGPQGAAPPRLFLVVDDLGYSPSADAGWLDVPARITMAVLPFGPSSRKIASSGKARGQAILIHVPMEPDSPSEDRTAGFRLRSGMGAGEMDTLFARMADNVPEAAGASNHMGSAFTRDPDAMGQFARLLKRRGLFFLDSLTTPRSVAADAAREAGVPSLRRDVFLDAGTDADEMRRQWRTATSLAREKGAAVVVCHARPETLRAVLSFLPELPGLGIQAATLADHPALGKR